MRLPVNPFSSVAIFKTVRNIVSGGTELCREWGTGPGNIGIANVREHTNTLELTFIP